jgi:two-component sensor histidine kinase
MYIKHRSFVFLLIIFLITTTSSAQQVYHKDGKMLSVEDLVKHNNPEEAIHKIDSLLEKTNKKDTEARLWLMLAKATVYDDNFEYEKSFSILLKILDESLPEKLYRISCETYLKLASASNKSADFEEIEKYLAISEKYIIKYKFEDLYSQFYNEKSGIQRLRNQLDSTIIYANKTLAYAQKYKNEKDIARAYAMLGAAYGPTDSVKAINYFNLAIPYFKKQEDYTLLAMMYFNIASEYLYFANIKEGLLYNDSAFLFYDKMNYFYKENIPKQRYDVYKYLGKADSALYYLEMTYNEAFNSVYFQNNSNIKEMSEKYESTKKAETIRKRNQLLIWIIVIAFIIIITSLLLFFQNRKIRKQNQKIQTQNLSIQQNSEELQKLLNQKQVLLSELQHRVKNNLQQVISILEIQKESIDFSNIEELVRSNQNRIHSMALLHKKLNIVENINSIDFDYYLQELTDLVSESYYDEKKNIKIFNQTSLGKTNIETAMPLGLIIVELISNSLKHAFHHQSEGVIKIFLTWNQELKKHQLNYTDNGSGFDFKPTEKKGLGVEIIEGLIDQINGNYIINGNNGFSIIVYF